MNPSKKDPARLIDHLPEIEAPSQYRRPIAADEAEPVRVVWLRMLWSERRFLLRATACGLTLSLLVALLLPVRYESQTRLMPPEQQSSSGLAMLAALATKGGGGSSASSSVGGLPGSLGGLATDVLGVKTNGALVVDMLRGPTVQDSLIKKFDLRKTYHAQYFQDARRALDQHTTIKEDRKSGVISIAVADRDPHRAQEMAQAYVEALNSLVAQVSTSSARRERMFLEQRLKTAKESLDTAAGQFSAFASKTGTLDMPAQTKAMVESEATLQGQLVAAESELEGLEQIYTDNNIRVRTLRARIAALRKQVENFSGNRSDPNSPESMIAGDLPSLRKLPVVGVRWTNLFRESKIQETVYELLTQEYELAKIQEAKEIPTLNVLDAALLPERKAFPPRTIITVLGTFLSLLLAGLFVIGTAKWRQSESPEKHLAAEIWGEITAENAKSRAMLQQAWSRFGVHNGRRPGKNSPQ
ncbi:MAG: lipopolysaccharide biosynthesis protein [Acidobacteria bacterium]|nr:lipopolysaccharide biosynthesis protein [Acidobacteriota bacterium]